jgi:hypothetical protein
MMIIGVDYHPSFQTIAFLMEETSECGEQELNHSDGQAEKFYRDLEETPKLVRVESDGRYSQSLKNEGDSLFANRLSRLSAFR